MKAIVQRACGDADVLKIEDIDRPVIGDNEVFLRVVTVAAPALLPAHKPANLSFEQVATVLLPGMTALLGLRGAGSVTPGQRGLIKWGIRRGRHVRRAETHMLARSARTPLNDGSLKLTLRPGGAHRSSRRGPSGRRGSPRGRSFRRNPKSPPPHLARIAARRSPQSRSRQSRRW